MHRASRPTRRWLGLLILFVGVFFLSTGHASTVLRLDLESLVANSEQIVLGDVVDRTSFEREGRIFTDIEVEVVENWKGTAHEETVTIRHPGGRVGDVTTRVHGLPEFKLKERIVVFLETTPKLDAFTVTGLRQGKFHVATGPDGYTEFVVPRLGNLQLLAPREQEGSAPEVTLRDRAKIDVRKLEPSKPASIHDAVHPLDEFRSRVRAAVVGEAATPEAGGGEQ